MPFSIIMIFISILIIVILIRFFANTISHKKPIKFYRSEYDTTDIGKDGEKFVKKILGQSVDGVKQVFNDYKFISGGKSVQIDHIFVNKNGVYVIETKNIHGTIYGNEEQHEWTQVLAYGNIKNKFYNPIKQNKSHIYNLSKFLPKNIELISLVVFIDADIENIDSDNVCTINELNKILNMEYETSITSKQIDYVANILRRYQNNNISNEEHVKEIRKLKRDVENNICPRCGAELILRDSEIGKFWGCSKYPKCKFKKNL